MPAGPYSIVNTASGTLITSITLVRLRGPGNTVLDFTLTHVSNNASTNRIGQVAKGWRHTFDEWIVPNATYEAQRNSPGGKLDWWYQDPVPGGPFERRPGVRDDLAKLTGPTHYVATHKDQTQATYGYNRSGTYCLTEFKDTHNNAINVTYDGSGRVQTVTDAAGRSLTLTWNPSNQYALSSLTLNTTDGSRTWDFVTDAGSNLTEIIFPAPVTGGSRPSISGMAYNADGTLSQLRPLRGLPTWYYEYQSFAGAMRLSNAYTLVTPASNITFAYASNVDGANTRTCTISLGGPTTKHIYDTSGNTYVNYLIKKVLDPLVTGDPAAFFATYVWNKNNGTLTSMTDRRGYLWQFTWDADNRGNLLTEKDPLLRTTEYLYSAQHNVLRVKDPLGHRVLYSYAPTTYDLTQIKVDPLTDPYDAGYSNPMGANILTNYAYSGQGNLTSMQVGSDPATTFSNYDAYGNARTVTNPLGKTWTATFDAFNNLLTSSEPLPGGMTTFTYDRWNRLTRVTHPDNNDIEYVYGHPINDPTGVIDENNHITYFDYDPYNRLVGVRRPMSDGSTLTTTIEYNTLGQITRVWPPKGTSYTTYSYDERGLMKGISYDGGTGRTFHYDGNGNVDRYLDGRSFWTYYAYDENSRLTTITYPTHPNAPPVSFTYYADGQRATMTDATGTYQWTYNGAHLVTGAYQPLPNKWVYYTYDANGRKKTVNLGAQTWTYNYNAADQVTSINETAGYATSATFGYYNHGLLSVKTLGNNTRTYYNYNQRHRLTSLSHRKIVGGTEPEQALVEYQHDPAGNVTWYREHEPPTAYDWTTTYGYDWADRLTSEVRASTPGTPSTYNFNNVYAYDKNGNRASVTRNGVPSTYTTGYNDMFLSGDGFTFDNYDGNGSPGRIWSAGLGGYLYLSYDAENRLIQVTYPSSAYDLFAYNGDGQRVRKIDGLGTTLYVYDGDACIGETNSAGTITAYYTLGVGFVYPGSSRKGFYQENALGSTLALSDETGAQASRYLYDGYGVTSTLAQGLFTPYQFVGQGGYYSDGGSGMHFLGHRYYLPKVGRFLTQDPIGQAGGLNLYAYTDNDPVDTIDLGGLLPVQGVAPENPPMDTGPTPPLPDIRYNSDWASTSANFSAGWGDQLTIWFFGGTRRLRDSITWGGTSINETIDFNSGEYLAGRGIGAVHELTLIGVARASWLREGKRWMEVNVGTGAKYLTYRYHTVYGVGEKLVHAAGKIPFLRVINWSARRNWKPWVTFKLPILYPERVLQTGQGARTCITAACSAFFRGWFKWR